MALKNARAAVAPASSATTPAAATARKTPRARTPGPTTPSKHNTMALLSLSAGALLAAPLGSATAADLPIVAPAPAQAQRLSATTATKFACVAAPQVRVSDDGLAPATAAGPGINLATPGSWDNAVERRGLQPVFELADLTPNAPNDAAGNYSDPAGRIQQEKTGTTDVREAAKMAAESGKQKLKEAVKGSSALPGAANSLATLADLTPNAPDDAAGNYSDPAGAIQQEKFGTTDVREAAKIAVDKLKGSAPDVGAAGESATADAQQALKSAISGSSALPGAANSLATLAEVDVNSDIRQLQAEGTATFQDRVQNQLNGGLSSTRTPNLGKKAKEAAADAKQSITEAIQGSSGSLPGTNSLATLADMTSNAKGDAADYKDPISSLGDKIAGSSPDLSSAGESAKSAASDAASDAAKSLKQAVKGSSALPGAVNSLATLADLTPNAPDDAAGNYSDPAGRIQQEKTGTTDVREAAKMAAESGKQKLKEAVKGSSALPGAANSLATLATDNAKGEAADYRDPAGAVQQDNVFGSDAPSKVKSAAKGVVNKAKAGGGGGLSIGNPAKDLKRAATNLGGAATNAIPGAGDSTSSASGTGNARLSAPLVRDSIGQLRPQAVNNTGAAGGGQKGLKKAVKSPSSVKQAAQDAIESVAN